MKNKLINILAEQYGVPHDKITLETEIFNDLKADSLDIVETQISLEKEFDIEIDKEEYENRTKVKDLLELLEAKLSR